MKIALFNCYSAKNSGDGLLVDLAAEKILQLYPGAQLTIIASDPSSFASRKYTVESNEFFALGFISIPFILLKVLMFLCTGIYKSSLYSKYTNYDLAFSVGGGYLRFGSCLETLKTGVVHLSQLAWISSNFGKSHIALSQSIGPFRFFPKGLLSKFFSVTTEIHLRDDRSFSDLKFLSGKIYREKDCAVEKFLADIKSRPSANTERNDKKCVVVLRDFRRGEKQTKDIIENIEKSLRDFQIIYATQSTIGGNDDNKFYKKYGLTTAGLLKEVLSDNKDAIVLSVRLHGALESMMCGHKTFHLSYERKGFGAFEDMGLSAFVDNVYAFKPESVSARLNELWEMNDDVYFRAN